MSLLIRNIRALVQCEETPKEKVSGKDMSVLPCIDNAYLYIEDGIIKDFGKETATLKSEIRSRNLFGTKSGITEIDAAGRFVLPCWCDSHTHIVYSSSREAEFVDRIKGLTYKQIAERGGGILNSVKRLHEASEAELVFAGLQRLREIMLQGTGAVEIKSGYGLTVEEEVKMLRVIRKLKNLVPLTIRSTFLGAHAIPEEYKGRKEKYVDHIINDMIPRVAKEKLADYCDVFCENGYFNREDTIRILEAAAAAGIKGKVHAEQLSHSGGIEAAVACKAVSVDHLEYISDSDISALLNSSIMPTLLPGAQFFLQEKPPPVRKMIDAGLPVAIASDYNPGSNPTGNMSLMVAFACILYKMTPEEAINAATINAAYAMGLSETHGSIARGKKANVFITKEIPSLAYLPYAYGSNLIEKVIINGEVYEHS